MIEGPETPHEAAHEPKRGPGAPIGNLNAAKHLLDSKRAVRDQRDRFRRRAEKDALQMLRDAGLQDRAWARVWARSFVRLESAASRFEARLDKRGWLGKDGQVKPDGWRFLDIVKDTLSAMTRLWDQMSGQSHGHAGAGQLSLEALVEASMARESPIARPPVPVPEPSLPAAESAPAEPVAAGPPQQSKPAAALSPAPLSERPGLAAVRRRERVRVIEGANPDRPGEQAPEGSDEFQMIPEAGWWPPDVQDEWE